MADLMKQDIDKIADFVINYYSYGEEDRLYIEWLIREHAKYDTMMVIHDGNGVIIALCRWNILPTGTDAHILDVIIHPMWRGARILHRMLIKGLMMYPDVKYLIYERRDKNKAFVKIPIRRLIKRRF